VTELRRVRFVIEHLEPVVSRWVWLEYKHASEIVGRERLVITNVRNPRERAKLAEIAAEVHEASVAELSLDEERLVVLDPQAPQELSPRDFEVCDYVVVGGIMGDYPPRLRTKPLLSDRLPRAAKRNIGKEQFAVDGAVYVAKLVSEGVPLSEIPYTVNLEITVGEFDGIRHTIVLPYAFPLRGGEPVISEELVRYLIHGIERDELAAIRAGRQLSVVELEGA